MAKAKQPKVITKSENKNVVDVKPKEGVKFIYMGKHPQTGKELYALLDEPNVL
jgi:hypothetical protein